MHYFHTLFWVNLCFHNHLSCSLHRKQFLIVGRVILKCETVSGKNGQQGDGDSDAEGSAEGDEDESDLDLAWKMLDVARAIVEKQSVNTMEQVDILSTLADVALERGIFTLLYLF